MKKLAIYLLLIISLPLTANTLSVTDFGANGNDNLDDTTAFQNCVNRLAELGGGSMEIPKGKYMISHLKFFGNRFSNITINGNQSTIIQLLPNKRTSVENGRWFTFAERKAADGCFIFDAMVEYQENDNLSIKNIKIKDLTFMSDVEKNKFDELLHQISAHGVSNFTVDNCKFIGFLGDGIAINASVDYKKYRNAYNKDIQITNCIFDGINNDNRQGISIYYSDGFLIDQCTFKNITRSDMPGAIDIEPNDDLQVVRNGIIKNCSFENIGGLGAICFVLQNSTAKNKFSNKNFKIENCTFKDVVAPLTVIGHDDYKNYSDQDIILFSNSKVINTKTAASLIAANGVRFSNIQYMNISSENLNVVSDKGASSITFEDCTFNGVNNPNGLGFVGNTTGINFLNCIFENFKINAITINQPEGIGSIRNNHFKSTAYPAGKPLVTSFYTRGKKLQNSKISKNTTSGNFSALDLSFFEK